MKTITKKQNWLTLPILLCSINLISQEFWTERFGNSVSNGDKGVQAAGYTTNNGTYTFTETGENGTSPNLWYVSSMEAGMGAGNCSSGYIENNSLTNNTLHISHQPLRGNVEAVGDFGAVYSIRENTDARIETPIINCSGKSNIKINFDYFTGSINETTDAFSLYYYDGSSWNLVNTFGPTPNGSCEKALWKNSDFYTLPSSANNNPNIKLGFRWVNEKTEADGVTSQGASTNTVEAVSQGGAAISQSPGLTRTPFSIAIDNISVSGSTYVDPNNNVNRTANTNKIDIKAIADANNKATIIFTTYSEKFPANNLVIESGMDGFNFTELTQIKSKATEGKITKIEYSFTDVKATEDLKYYRVKQFNADKRVVISPVVSFPVNAQRTANTNKIDIKTVADKKSNPNIVFTTYSEKFPANDLVIESSTDGTDFNELSKIKSKAVKGSVTKLEYSFSDANANDGVNYYRIKQVNADKTAVISKIVSVDHIKAKNITFTVYPNPNSGQFTVDFSGIENNHEVQIVLNDMNDGHEIYSTTFYSNSIDSNKMDVNPPTKIAPGRYICSLIFEGIRSSVIVMIN